LRDNKNSSIKQEYLNSLIGVTAEPGFLQIANKARLESKEIGKELISLSFFEANCIHQIIKQFKCKNFVEIGSLTGFSAIFILNALLSGGKLYCFEKNPKWILFLEQNLSLLLKLKLNSQKTFKIFPGEALENLKLLSLNHKIDGFFIDANKSAYLDYLQIAENLLIPGGLVIADNVFLNGSVWGEENPKFSKKQIEVMKAFNQRIFDPKFYDSFIIDSSDGLSVSIKK
jgi:predicted O-methyltransferase YrrM